MQDDTSELDQLQSTYKAAVEEWIAAIKQEETLASVNIRSRKSTSGSRRTSPKTHFAAR